jgi:hypothetical protein
MKQRPPPALVPMRSLLRVECFEEREALLCGLGDESVEGGQSACQSLDVSG